MIAAIAFHVARGPIPIDVALHGWPTGLAVGLARKGPRYRAVKPRIRPTTALFRDGQRFPRSDRAPGGGRRPDSAGVQGWRGSIGSRTALCLMPRRRG